MLQIADKKLYLGGPNKWYCGLPTRSDVADSRQEVILRIADKKWCCGWPTRSDIADSRQEVVLRMADKK
jgi:hypothetical protein